jgi:poly-beta-1,6-N-acetyl-D-glucosamine synthase
MSTRSYVLVTPVKDEASTIGLTIASVVRQTVLPREWVIVSDGSTDGTDEIVGASSRLHEWIRLLPRGPRPDRSFAAVVLNTLAGIRALNCHDYEYLGLLDADVSFQDDYFEQLLNRFEANARLGLAGGVVIDSGAPRTRLPRNRVDVPGAVQFFRRTCFDSIGMLFPIPEGGWDAVACAMARMRGFETQLMIDLIVDHLKPRNISQGGPIRRIWQIGVRDYAVGYDPIFELVKCVGRVNEQPILLGSVSSLCGYFTAALQRKARVVPSYVVAHLRREQRQRLCRMST